MKTTGAVTGFVLTTMFVGALVPMSVGAAERPSDSAITSWVDRALAEDPRVVSSDIRVSANDGIVTLAGTVRNLAEKKYADLETKKIKGVRGVVNKLDIATSRRSDADMAQEIRRRIIISAVIKSDGLGVRVIDGNVVLSGTVASYSERQQAELLASEVRGVKSVTDNLVVSYSAKRSDADIRRDVEAELDRDIYLVGLPIAVSTTNGVVTLTGQVGNAYQKDRAFDDANWVGNVFAVKNDLKVVWWQNDGVREKTATPSDAELATSVRDELWQDLRIVDPWDISVKAEFGNVTLRGTVPTYYQKWMAGQAAKEVVGVGWVSNMINVKPEWRDDRAIRSDVDFAIHSDYALYGDEIGVRVNDGIVTLTGNVNYSYERSQAGKDVAAVLGVADLVNEIAVNWQPKFNDAALRERITNRLDANGETWWVSNRITVAVTRGVATLTGDVDRWSQYNEAARIAYRTDGVRAVDNRLTVKEAQYKWDERYGVYPDLDFYGPYDDDEAYRHHVLP